MTEYTNIDLGTFEQIAKLDNGKAFLHDALNLSSCEISVNVTPPQKDLKFRLITNINKMKRFILF